MIDDSLTIYATTAANAFESSWGCYCPGMQPGPGSEFTTCLGDLYSVAFLENRLALMPCPFGHPQHLLVMHLGHLVPQDCISSPAVQSGPGCRLDLLTRQT